MKLAEAQAIAVEVIELLSSRCQRIEIAGSVRRGKAEVKDLELCAVPIHETIYDLFGQPKGELVQLETFPWTLLGEVKKNGPRYKQIALKEGINLDLFIVLPPADWGVIYTIRTGPAEFSRWSVTPRNRGGGLPSNSKVTSGFVLCNSIYVPMPEEIDFLNFLGLGWVEPQDRKPGWERT